MVRKSVVWFALIGLCLMGGAASAQLVVKVNFQLETAAVPAGYLRDSGDVFGDRGNGYSYGWSASATADDRERNAHADKRYDTLVHFSKNADKTWEIALPAGKYNLFLVCGDASNVDQTNTLDIEGVIVTDPDGQDNFDEYTVNGVAVTDGRLSIKPAPGASNAKICFIDITQAIAPTKAREPSPADAATDVPRDTVLSWTAPENVAKHFVYLGTDLDQVTNATVGEERLDATYEPAGLAYGQTYYWRVDEVNATSAKVTKGDIWSFTVEPFSYPITKVTATASSFQASMGPENTVGGVGLDADDQHSVDAKTMWLSGDVSPAYIQYEFEKPYKLDQMWVWNSNQMIESFIGFGAKGVTVEYSEDGATWTELPGVPEFAQAPGVATSKHNTTVDFGGAVAKYVRLTINSTWGGVSKGGLAEVRFYYVPVQAFQPVPADAATGVELDATLSWRPGREVGSHKVYFGKDKDAVAGGTVAAKTVADYSFAPATMDLASAYYWRVDEVNGTSVYAGDVWSFSTRSFLVVDDFESYTDDEGSRIYEFWIDGITDGKSGSTVGYMEAPFAERTIVHGGAQSMPMAYDNTKMAMSEATLTFDTAQNWTASGIKSLSLFFRGAAENTGTGKLYVKINGVKVAYSGDAADITKPLWAAWNIDLSKVTGNLSKVTSLTVGVEGAGSTGTIYIDDIGLYSTVAASAQAPVITAIVRAKGQPGTRTDASPITTFTDSTTPLFLVAGLRDGATCFSDRPYPWANTPAELIGADYVLMFNTDKNAGETDVTYTVTLARAATVYLTCDDRITAQQAAVDKVVAAFAQAGQFKNTGLKLYIRESATVDRPMSVFSGDLPAGTYVFGAQDSTFNFYTIAAIGK
jgi:uncharacterized Zn-binding protein involved in type VI secretion